MTTIELKKSLIQRIGEINDESFLKAIKTILDSKAQERILILNQSQINEIVESKKQKLYTDQDELDQKFEKWLCAE
jgi:phosphotransacetylase